MRSDWTAALLSPKARLETSLTYSGNPGIGAYSETTCQYTSLWHVPLKIRGGVGGTLVKVLGKDAFFGFEDALEDVGLALVIAVRTDPETHFLQTQSAGGPGRGRKYPFILVGLEFFGKTCLVSDWRL
jgi:hypothetical protein